MRDFWQANEKALANSSVGMVQRMIRASIHQNFLKRLFEQYAVRLYKENITVQHCKTAKWRQIA